MHAHELNLRLSQISTSCVIVQQANEGTSKAMSEAQKVLLERYSGAAKRFLSAALHDEEAADELTQEFGLCLVSGGLGGANPERGRFRNYVKGVLFHLVSTYHRLRRRWPRPVSADNPTLLTLQSPTNDEEKFQEQWRDELLARAWELLRQVEPTGYLVLRYKAEHPGLRSAAVAQRLSPQLGRALTAEGVRQILHQARDQLAGLLIGEVAHTLQAPTAESVLEELGELKLLEYCRPALKRHGLVE